MSIGVLIASIPALLNQYLCIMYRLFSLFALLTLSHLAFGQQTDEELAAQYFADGEYDKAEILYKKLLKKNDESVYIYQNYLECLVRLKSFDEAEKMIKKQEKRFPDKPIYSVDLGFVYGLTQQDKKRDELFDNLIANMPVGMTPTDLLANAFLKREYFDHAIKTYQTGRKNLRNDILFTEQLIDLYQQTKNFKGVIDESMLLLNSDDRSLELVKSKLVRLVDEDIETDYLQERVALSVQKNPSNSSFDELLLWVFIQQKKFSSALRQANAMDRRNRTEGKSLINLARICVSNRSFDVAVDCYQKVLDFGPEAYYYLVARMGLLETSFLALQSNPNLTTEVVQELVNKHKSFLAEFGTTWNTASTAKELADIYIYYAHDLDRGIALLDELIQIPRLQPHIRGQYKLALGDAYLIKNEVWDAALLYGQVDKDFKEDPLGQEAKFRNARLSYFTGDFDWAKDQLDVLKTATSQLISNNAIELALTIQDNTGLDSSTEALAAYAQAQLLLFQNKLDACLDALTLLPFKFPNHSLQDEIVFTKAQVMERKHDYQKAVAFYKQVMETYFDDILADNAVYRLGVIYDDVLDDDEEARKMYEHLIFNYSGSLFVVEARKRYNSLPPAPKPANP